MKRVLGLLLGLFLISTVATSQTTAKDWNKSGVDHFKKMEYKEAFECFSKAIALDPKFGEAYFNRANSWYQLPSDAYPDHDGCTDLKKAKELGVKAANARLVEYGCKLE